MLGGSVKNNTHKMRPGFRQEDPERSWPEKKYDQFLVDLVVSFGILYLMTSEEKIVISPMVRMAADTLNKSAITPEMTAPTA